MEDHRWQILERKRLRVRTADTFAAIVSAGFTPLLFKGEAAANFYPDDVFRTYTDTDLAVESNKFDELISLLRTKAFNRFHVDLHLGLRHLDTLPFNQIFERSVFIDVEGTAVRVPCPEDHLRIMAVHWLNDGGQFKERLWDIYYAVANRPPDFDWDKCLGVVSSTRRTWVVTAIGLAHKYLQLPIDDLPFAEEATMIPDWITRTVEAEWATEIRLLPIQTVLRRPKLLIQQLRKRFPPNAIQATIETEGEFDEGSRIRYQIGSVLKRIGPSLSRVRTALFRSSRKS